MKQTIVINWKIEHRQEWIFTWFIFHRAYFRIQISKSYIYIFLDKMGWRNLWIENYQREFTCQLKVLSKMLSSDKHFNRNNLKCKGVNIEIIYLRGLKSTHLYGSTIYYKWNKYTKKTTKTTISAIFTHSLFSVSG